MKIALISYEYPPDAAFGGIGTYVYQVSRLLQNRGHHVEVFSSSPARSGTVTEDGIIAHRISGVDQRNFAVQIGQVFAERHSKVQFDVIEGPEFQADAREAIRLVPDIPLVVKLHSPQFLLNQLHHPEFFHYKKVRHSVSLIRRGANPVRLWRYEPKHDIEYLHTQDADEIVILTQSMADRVARSWQLELEKVSYIPNPYIPSATLLKIPVATQTDVVTFVGRLKIRKGVIELAQAIPFVLQQRPQTQFRFVGPAMTSPHAKLDMQQYLARMLQRYHSSIEFTGAVPSAALPSVLESTDICVFPSIWENFPNVCLEAMAAARGIVGSSAGGMTEMLDHGKVGRLVPPRNPRRIASALIELLTNPDLRMQLGQAARDRLLNTYSADKIGVLLEASYVRAIQRRQQAGPRNSHLTASVAR